MSVSFETVSSREAFLHSSLSGFGVIKAETTGRCFSNPALKQVPASNWAPRLLSRLSNQRLHIGERQQGFAAWRASDHHLGLENVPLFMTSK